MTDVTAPADHQYPALSGKDHVARVVNGILRGHANVSGRGTITGTAGAATVIDDRCHAGSVVISAARKTAEVNFEVVAYHKGKFDISWNSGTHGNTIAIRYVILG